MGHAQNGSEEGYQCMCVCSIGMGHAQNGSEEGYQCMCVCSIADKAWGMLRTALKRVGAEDQTKVLRNVARKLLSMGRDLPQWLLDTYKVRRSAEMLFPSL